MKILTGFCLLDPNIYHKSFIKTLESLKRQIWSFHLSPKCNSTLGSFYKKIADIVLLCWQHFNQYNLLQPEVFLNKSYHMFSSQNIMTTWNWWYLFKTITLIHHGLINRFKLTWNLSFQFVHIFSFPSLPSSISCRTLDNYWLLVWKQINYFLAIFTKTLCSCTSQKSKHKIGFLSDMFTTLQDHQ